MKTAPRAWVSLDHTQRHLAREIFSRRQSSELIMHGARKHLRQEMLSSKSRENAAAGHQ
jgi:hypothetical protein